MNKRHVFVFGLNDFNRRKLEKVRGGEAIEFHQLPRDYAWNVSRDLL